MALRGGEQDLGRPADGNFGLEADPGSSDRGGPALAEETLDLVADGIGVHLYRRELPLPGR